MDTQNLPGNLSVNDGSSRDYFGPDVTLIIATSTMKKRNSSNTGWVTRNIALTSRGEIVQLPHPSKVGEDAPAQELLQHHHTRVLLALFAQSPRGRHHSCVKVIDRTKTSDFAIMSATRSLRLRAPSQQIKERWLCAFKYCLGKLNSRTAKKIRTSNSQDVSARNSPTPEPVHIRPLVHRAADHREEQDFASSPVNRTRIAKGGETITVQHVQVQFEEDNETEPSVARPEEETGGKGGMGVGSGMGLFGLGALGVSKNMQSLILLFSVFVALWSVLAASLANPYDAVYGQDAGEHVSLAKTLPISLHIDSNRMEDIDYVSKQLEKYSSEADRLQEEVLEATGPFPLPSLAKVQQLEASQLRVYQALERFHGLLTTGKRTIPKHLDSEEADRELGKVLSVFQAPVIQAGDNPEWLISEKPLGMSKFPHQEKTKDPVLTIPVSEIPLKYRSTYTALLTSYTHYNTHLNMLTLQRSPLLRPEDVDPRQESMLEAHLSKLREDMKECDRNLYFATHEDKNVARKAVHEALVTRTKHIDTTHASSTSSSSSPSSSTSSSTSSSPSPLPLTPYSVYASFDLIALLKARKHVLQEQYDEAYFPSDLYKARHPVHDPRYLTPETRDSLISQYDTFRKGVDVLSQVLHTHTHARTTSTIMTTLMTLLYSPYIGVFTIGSILTLVFAVLYKDRDMVMGVVMENMMISVPGITVAIAVPASVFFFLYGYILPVVTAIVTLTPLVLLAAVFPEQTTRFLEWEDDSMDPSMMSFSDQEYSQSRTDSVIEETLDTMSTHHRPYPRDTRDTRDTDDTDTAVTSTSSSPTGSSPHTNTHTHTHTSASLTSPRRKPRKHTASTFGSPIAHNKGPGFPSQRRRTGESGSGSSASERYSGQGHSLPDDTTDATYDDELGSTHPSSSTHDQDHHSSGARDGASTGTATSPASPRPTSNSVPRIPPHLAHIGSGTVTGKYKYPLYKHISTRHMTYVHLLQRNFPKLLEYGDYHYRPQDWRDIGVFEGVKVQEYTQDLRAIIGDNADNGLLCRGYRTLPVTAETVFTLLWKTEEVKAIMDPMCASVQLEERVSNHVKLERQVYKGFGVVSHRYLQIVAGWQRMVFNDDPNAEFASPYFAQNPDFTNTWRYRNVDMLNLYDRGQDYPVNMRDHLPELASQPLPTRSMDGFEYTRDGIAMLAVTVDGYKNPDPRLRPNPKHVEAKLAVGGFFIRGVKIPITPANKEILSQLPYKDNGRGYVYGCEVVGLGAVDLNGNIPSFIKNQVAKRQPTAIAHALKLLRKKDNKGNVFIDSVDTDFLYA